MYCALAPLGAGFYMTSSPLGPALCRVALSAAPRAWPRPFSRALVPIGRCCCYARLRGAPDRCRRRRSGLFVTVSPFGATSGRANNILSGCTNNILPFFLTSGRKLWDCKTSYSCSPAFSSTVPVNKLICLRCLSHVLSSFVRVWSPLVAVYWLHMLSLHVQSASPCFYRCNFPCAAQFPAPCLLPTGFP